MIVESPASVRLMAALMDVGATGATREHLIRKADIGTTTFYRLLGPLIEHGLVTVAGNRYHAPLNVPYNLRFKLWYDVDRLYRLAHMDRSAVLDITRQVRQALGPGLRCLWLVGSAAQDQLTPESDLDFLAVTASESRFHPGEGAGRKINFVIMTEEEFRERYQRSDGFIASALRYGIVLFERDFAEEFYATPPPVAISAGVAHAEEQDTEQQRSRALAFLEQDRIEEARAALQSFAVSVGRLLLRAFGELPASRIALVAATQAYFGKGLSRCLSRALQARSLNREEVVRLSRRLSDYHRSFQSQLSHLQGFASLPSAEPVAMEALCARVLRELIPEGEVVEGSHGGTHIQAAAPSRSRYLVQCKSLSGMLSVDPVHQLIEYGRTHAKTRRRPRLLLVANAFRELPLLERPNPFSEEARHLSTEHGVALLTGIDLLRAHNALHLEGIAPSVVLAALLNGRPP